MMRRTKVKLETEATFSAVIRSQKSQ